MAATTEAAYTTTQTTAMMQDTNLNPVSNEQNCEVQVTLQFNKVTFDPAKLLGALELYGATIDLGVAGGAIGTITGKNAIQTDFVPSRNNYNFIVS